MPSHPRGLCLHTLGCTMIINDLFPYVFVKALLHMHQGTVSRCKRNSSTIIMRISDSHHTWCGHPNVSIPGAINGAKGLTTAEHIASEAQKQRPCAGISACFCLGHSRGANLLVASNMFLYSYIYVHTRTRIQLRNHLYILCFTVPLHFLAGDADHCQQGYDHFRCLLRVMADSVQPAMVNQWQKRFLVAIDHCCNMIIYQFVVTQDRWLRISIDNSM